MLAGTPADQTMVNTVAFTQAIQEAAAGTIVILGIAYDRPETGCGYIQMTPSMRGEAEAVHPVQRFVERPTWWTRRFAAACERCCSWGRAAYTPSWHRSPCARTPYSPAPWSPPTSLAPSPRLDLIVANRKIKQVDVVKDKRCIRDLFGAAS